MRIGERLHRPGLRLPPRRSRRRLRPRLLDHRRLRRARPDPRRSLRPLPLRGLLHRRDPLALAAELLAPWPATIAPRVSASANRPPSAKTPAVGSTSLPAKGRSTVWSARRHHRARGPQLPADELRTPALRTALGVFVSACVLDRWASTNGSSPLPSPGAGRAGERLRLNRGGKPFRSKRLDKNCVVRFFTHLRRPATFRALLVGSETIRSGRLTVKALPPAER